MILSLPLTISKNTEHVRDLEVVPYSHLCSIGIPLRKTSETFKGIRVLFLRGFFDTFLHFTLVDDNEQREKFYLFHRVLFYLRSFIQLSETFSFPFLIKISKIQIL